MGKVCDPVVNLWPFVDLLLWDNYGFYKGMFQKVCWRCVLESKRVGLALKARNAGRMPRV